MGPRVNHSWFPGLSLSLYCLPVPPGAFIQTDVAGHQGPCFRDRYENSWMGNSLSTTKQMSQKLSPLHCKTFFSSFGVLDHLGSTFQDALSN